MKVTLLCLTLCDPMDCSLLGSSVHGILQAWILEWVAIPFSRRSSWPRDRTQFSCFFCIAGRFFTIWATREDLIKEKIEIASNNTEIFSLIIKIDFKWLINIISLEKLKHVIVQGEIDYHLKITIINVVGIILEFNSLCIYTNTMSIGEFKWYSMCF